MMSVAALVALLALLALLDSRVRDGLTDLAPEGVWDRVSSERGRLMAVGSAARDIVVSHETLTIFVVAGSALVACMLRT